MYIDRKKLKEHQKYKKTITKNKIYFSPCKKNKLPKPLDKLRSTSNCSDLIDVSDNYCVFFTWKDGEILERKSIYAYLFQKQAKNQLYPLARLDYHPSHKGLHIKINCEDKRNLQGRHLPGCKEFQLKLDTAIDPAKEQDRNRFICIACEKFGIILDDKDRYLL